MFNLIPRALSKLVRIALLIIGLLSPLYAKALQLSDHGFRLQDSKHGTLIVGADRIVIEKRDQFQTILVLWGEAEIFGEAEEIVLLSGKLRFHPGSRVTKKLMIIRGDFESSPGAAIAGEQVVFESSGPFWRVVHSLVGLWREYYSGVVWWLVTISFSLITWLIGLLVFGLFPGLQKNTADSLGREWGKNLLIGIFSLIFLPVSLALLIISIIGIFLLPIYFLLLGLAALLSYLVAALWLGHRLLPAKKGRRLNPWGFILGIFTLQFLLAVSWSWFLGFFILLLSFGSIARSLGRIWR